MPLPERLLANALAVKQVGELVIGQQLFRGTTAEISARLARQVITWDKALHSVGSNMFTGAAAVFRSAIERVRERRLPWAENPPLSKFMTPDEIRSLEIGHLAMPLAMSILPEAMARAQERLLAA